MKKVLLIFGTRPEAIKMAMVIRELQKIDTIDTYVVVTAQHREMLDQVLSIFSIVPNYDLDIMMPNQDLFDISAKGLTGLRGILQEVRPDLVLVQGDTTSTFIGSLAAYYQKIAVGHIEAGLRTHNRYAPFPEEINRRLTGVIADLHFAPTERARENLLGENVSAHSIFVTGNTSIDALLWTVANSTSDFRGVLPANGYEEGDGRFVLATAHRRESFGRPMKNIMDALNIIADRFKPIPIIFPVHHNPNVRRETLKLRDKENIVLIDPMGYKDFAHLMSKAYLILTDSGGIQEEAPSLGKPVLVLRETTERPEGIEAGNAKLVGTDTQVIVAEATRLLSDPSYYQTMAGRANPYGDGRAAVRIMDVINKFLSAERSPS
jgi:UDP-N-acetylglucosamine 2-epimerase (non-hydrolysing)